MSVAADTLLRALADSAAPVDADRMLMVVAHPDDETVALGGQLSRLRGLHLLHVTDGAPADMADAARLGFPTRDAYAASRRSELARAMALAGIQPERLSRLGLVDQRVLRALPELARQLADRMAGADVILTHAFEGGHPDHDATAFAVAAAAALIRRGGGVPPAIVEMAEYHAGGAGGLVTNRLLPVPAGGPPSVTLQLDARATAAKRQMLAAYSTQAGVLGQFGAEREELRRAPAHDFLTPPHAGTLWYARFRWGGVDWPTWRAAAVAAVGALGLGGPPWR